METDRTRVVLRQVIPLEFIRPFKVFELENLICGFASVDVEDLKINTIIDISDDHSNPDIVFHFWSILHEFSQLDLSRLVQFVTGSSQVPAGGFRYIEPPFQICFDPNGEGKDREDVLGRQNESSLALPLPSSSTCFNTLTIPNYSTRDILFEKLNMALHESVCYFGQL